MPNPTPNLSELLQTAMQHHRAGQLADAERLYRQILAQQPNHANALHLLGVVAAQSARFDIAVNLIRQAIALQPNFPDAWQNLAHALKQNRQLPESIAAYRHALTLRPDVPEFLDNLALALRANGQPHEAIAVYRRALALKPDSAEAYNNLGNALRESGQLDEATAAQRHAIALRPDFPEAHNDLGSALNDQGHPPEAIAAYRRAIALRPTYAEAHTHLGSALHASGQLDSAINAYRQAIAINPNLAEIHSSLGNTLKEQGQLEQSIAAHRHAIALSPNRPDIHSNLILTLHYPSNFDSAAVAHELSRWNQQHAEPLRKFIQPHNNDRTPNRRLKIGYVSPDFREHAVARFLLPLLANHDHQQFEIFCYAQVPNPDAVTNQLRAHADHWHNIVGIPDDQLAEQIRKDQIDILVDLAGHTANHRLLLFARKPAPIQVTYLGYPGSTGLPTMDYRLTDAFADPPGMTESLHCERLFRLPNSAWCFQPPESPSIEPRPEHPLTFGSFNNFSKVTTPTLQFWARILQAVPSSKLVLKNLAVADSSTRNRVQALMQSQGVDPAHVDLLGYTLSYADHLALYRTIDIALDTFPYHGTTTTCEALWMGVPVVSLAGQTHVSRAAVSLLSNVGLPELIAQTPEQYIQLACGLAQDKPRLTQLRQTLRNQMQNSPLMNAPQFARDIEAAYRQMWTQWCGNAPT